MGDPIATRAARLRSIFLNLRSMSMPNISSPQPGVGWSTHDAAALLNWRTWQTNMQALLATVNMTNIAACEAALEKMPATQWWGTP